MLRKILMSVAVLGLVAMADQAEARGRRGGCSGGSCGVSYSGGCPGGQCQVSAAPVHSTPVASVESIPMAPAQPAATVNSGYSNTSRYARWRSGSRRFR